MGIAELLRRPGSPASLLAVVVLLSVVLDSAWLLTQEQQDLPTVKPNSSLNVKFDPKTTRLTWDCKENTTYGECVLIHKEKGRIKKKVKDNECHCTFPDCSLHGGVTLTVQVNVNQRRLSERLVYSNPGREGTAARNFSCVIYDADFMNCSWAKGRAAPDDVQYFLYTRSKKRIERECPHYLKDSGTHVGCHLRDLSGLTSYGYFLVNGTSQETGIQFFDSLLLLKEIEQYNAPDNITVRCNESHCLIRWEQPRTRQPRSNREFQYQLDIQRWHDTSSSRNQPIVVFGDSGNRYNFPKPGSKAKHTVKIRTADARKARWGAWSQPVEFGSEEPESSLVHVYILVVLGTLVCGLTLSCLFKSVFSATAAAASLPHHRTPASVFPVSSAIRQALSDAPEGSPARAEYSLCALQSHGETWLMGRPSCRACGCPLATSLSPGDRPPASHLGVLGSDSPPPPTPETRGDPEHLLQGAARHRGSRDTTTGCGDRNTCHVFTPRTDLKQKPCHFLWLSEPVTTSWGA